ncbi:hypothetical protein BDV93DRAFT_545144 [Ceratobasidium sp. AG-I]|nr:hypothetical protein BDV93DRAFT_545144 [Ceratobasidium sp. AG-I]
MDSDKASRAQLQSEYTAILDCEPEDYDVLQFARLLKRTFPRTRTRTRVCNTSATSLSLLSILDPRSLKGYSWIPECPPMPPRTSSSQNTSNMSQERGAPHTMPEAPTADSRATAPTSFGSARDARYENPEPQPNNYEYLPAPSNYPHPSTAHTPTGLPFLGRDGHTFELPPILGNPQTRGMPLAHHAPPLESPMAPGPTQLAPLAGPATRSHAISHARSGSEASYGSWSALTHDQRPFAASVTSAPSSDAVHTPDTSRIGPDLPWSSTRAHSINSSSRSASSAVGGPKAAFVAPAAQPLHLPVYHAPQMAPPGPPTTGLPVGGDQDSNNLGEADSDEEGSEHDDEFQDDVDEQHGGSATTKSKGMRAPAIRRVGGPAVVPPDVALQARGTVIKFFEHGEMINWLFDPEAPTAWAKLAVSTEQSRAKPHQIFELMSEKAFHNGCKEIPGYSALYGEP